MIVAVITMGMVQVAVHEIAHMIAMGHRLVAAAGAMDMTGLVAAAIVLRRALIGIGGAHLDHMFVDMVPVGMVEMAVMQIVHMVAVLDRGMAAIGAVLVGMVLVDFVFVVAHDLAPSVRMMFAGMFNCVLNKMKHVIIG